MESASRPSNRTVESLGKLTYETKPNTSNLVAGMIIAALLVGGGFTLCGYMIKKKLLSGASSPQAAVDWMTFTFASLLGIALVVGGVFLFLWVKSLFGFRLYVHHDGFYFTRRGTDFVFAWDEILLVRENILQENLPLAKGPARWAMSTRTSRSYTVVRCDGKEFGFNENIIPRTSLLAGPLSSAAKTHGFAWETTEDTM